jgi:hypothetical protein
VSIKNLHPPKFCFTKFRRARAKIIRDIIEIRTIFDNLFIHILVLDPVRSRGRLRLRPTSNGVDPVRSRGRLRLRPTSNGVDPVRSRGRLRVRPTSNGVDIDFWFAILKLLNVGWILNESAPFTFPPLLPF